MKHLIIFTYFERPHVMDNLRFFTEHGILPPESDCTFLIVTTEAGFSVPIPELPNVRVIKRLNEGYDFAGWGAGLDAVDLSQFDRFVFLNDTALGPFLPRYVPQGTSWVELFTHPLSDQVKLVGSTINYLPHHPDRSPHIQTYAWGTDRVGLDILNKRAMFKPTTSEKQDIIEGHEIGASRAILESGYELFAFQLSENANSKISEIEKLNDDPLFDNCYYGLSVNPLEVMFIKSTRLANRYILNYKAWTDRVFIPY